MQKINPLFILLFVLVLFAFFYVKESEVKMQLDLSAKNYIKVSRMLENIIKLKDRWKDSKKRLDKVLSMREYKNLKIKKIKTKDGFKVSIDGIKADKFDRLFDRLINSYIRYKSISLLKTKDSMQMTLEIYK